MSEWGQVVKAKAYLLGRARYYLLGKPEMRELGFVKTVRSESEEVSKRPPKLFRKLGVLPEVFRITPSQKLRHCAW